MVSGRFTRNFATDWKGCKFLAKEGDIIGCDFAGVVSEVGPGTDTSFVKIGDRVASFVHGSKDQDVGAFTEYVKTESVCGITALNRQLIK